MGLEVLLYVPNVIGYIRILLIIVSWFTFYSNPGLSCVLYTISTCLDALDGYAARKLTQTSAFGAWFDVVIDNIGRGMMWCRLYHFGYLVSALEWLTFVCTHTLGASWKTNFTHEPWLVTKVMENGYKTPLGVVAIGGVHCLPIWLYAHYHQLLDALLIPSWLQYILIGLLSGGRAVAAVAEGWFIWAHILYLISDEANKNKNPST